MERKSSLISRGSKTPPSEHHRPFSHHRSRQSIIREWLRLRESPRVEDVTVYDSRTRDPCFVLPACNSYRNDDDLNRIEECPVEENVRKKSFLRSVVEKMALSRFMSTLHEGDLTKIHQTYTAEVHEIEFPSKCGGRKWRNFFGVNEYREVIDPHGKFYFAWLFVVSLCYIYNLIAVPMRASFPYQTPENTPIWLTFDLICDLFYLIDVLMIKPRVSFIHDGSWVQDTQITKESYHKKFLFKMDVLSLLPLEIFYLYFGTSAVELRLPRMCKAQTFSQFYTSVDKMLSSPLIIRVCRTLIYTFYLIHLNACSYYKVSDFQGIGSNGWVYDGKGNAYIRCFYFATKTSTSIGKNPKPDNDFEHVYMTFAWLMGVCVFALLVGQIRYFIITASKSETEYRKLLAETLKCMRELNIPIDLQKRVTSWFEFTWKQQGTLDDNKSLSALPINLKTELAINMHIKTLNKVKLFTDCEQALLRDLVLKLRSIIYLPGDLICKKGDVGREMYILQRGEVQVMSGSNNNEVIATLCEGSVFGEISLLNIKGINRRTADVRSRTFSNIFILSKIDFNSVLAYYPEAQKLLLARANDLVNINAAREQAKQESEMSSSPTTPTKSNSDEIIQIENDENDHKSLFEGEPVKVPRSVEILTSEELKRMEDVGSYFEKIRKRAMPKNFGRKKFLNPNRCVNLKNRKISPKPQVQRLYIEKKDIHHKQE